MEKRGIKLTTLQAQILQALQEIAKELKKIRESLEKEGKKSE